MPDSFIGSGGIAAETRGLHSGKVSNWETLNTARALGRERSGFATTRQEAEIGD